MGRLGTFFSPSARHRKPKDLPRSARRQLYTELIDVMEEEDRMRDMLDLPLAPQLSIVDEMRVAILRPADRQAAREDKQFAAAEFEHKTGEKS